MRSDVVVCRLGDLCDPWRVGRTRSGRKNQIPGKTGPINLPAVNPALRIPYIFMHVSLRWAKTATTL